MRDISARELKGHNILAVERFWDDTRWMIEFSVLRPSAAYGSLGEEMRLFLTEDRKQCRRAMSSSASMRPGYPSGHCVAFPFACMNARACSYALAMNSRSSVEAIRICMQQLY